MVVKIINKLLLFTAPVIDFLNGAVTIVNKSMVTKTVPNHELGKYSYIHTFLKSIFVRGLKVGTLLLLGKFVILYFG